MIQTLFDYFVKLFYFVKFFEKMIMQEGFHNHITSDTIVEDRSDNLLVLANGPSLRNTLDDIYSGKIKRENCCMVNYTVNTDDFYKIKPEYYIISDPKFYVRGKYHREAVDKVYENLNAITWKMNVYIQYTWYKDKEYMRLFKNENLNVVPMHTREYNGFECLRNWLMKHDIGGANFGTVIHHAIHVGVLLGYKEVHLYGADHTFFTGICVTDDNILCRETNHVYGTDTAPKPIYWFDPITGERHSHNMASFLHEYANLFDGHIKMKKFSDYMGVRVINKTEVSLLDVFPRK
ncbi:MAG: hypothetical protein IKO82_07520 [Prevotella sp.]|nr:hypothetical protein [Prevotella sp.]